MTLTSDFNPSAPNVTYQRMRQLLAESGGGLQAGVVGANDLKVAQRGAGANMSVDVPAGAAWVAITTGTRNGLAHVYNDATANVAVTASNATNPRIDSILLRYNDTTVPTGSGSTPTLEVATGTATAGATLDNRTGAASPTGDFIRLADIIVPAASTSVVTANIRDRRPWARGAFFRSPQTGGDIAVTWTTFGGTFSSRLECSGAPLRISLFGRWSHNTASAQGILRPGLDSAAIDGGVGDYYLNTFTAGFGAPIALSYITVPSPGSHTVDIMSRTSSGTLTISANAATPALFVVEEVVRQNSANP